MLEAIEANAGGLDRVTGDIQVAVMRTRMQPLDKLFGKYPRLIRDLAKKTGKKINLVIEGGETEVDKSVIEELGDPLVHLLRNSADHGLEPPEERAAAGKDETGIIALVAAHEGSHVSHRHHRRRTRTEAAKSSAGRPSSEGSSPKPRLQSWPTRTFSASSFEAGFSTADEVSDLSGRGVGMDVVRTNIENLKGSIDLDSRPGRARRSPSRSR
jgi:two-component system chemotaxis sensor kinase CheA